MSDIHEKVGGLFFPVKKFESYDNSGCYLNIGVWHHPYNWITPNTPENNKKEFQHLTERIASVHFLGHEHENEFYNNENKTTGDRVNLLSGKVFNEDTKPKVSGFQTLIIDLETRKGQLKVYDWKSEIYGSHQSNEVVFYENSSKKLTVDIEFLKGLEEIKIPLVIGDRKQVGLSEIYVFPDLEVINSEAKVMDQYNDAIGILKNKYGNCVITGEDQIGKSSLLNIVYLKKYDEGKFPLRLFGKDIKDIDLTKILKRAFKSQYLDGEENFETYLQLDKSQKILLLDNYQDCQYNTVTMYKLLKEVMEKFELVILTISSTYSMLPAMQTEFKDIGFYRIKPLGYSKRNELIEKYHFLKGNLFINDAEYFATETKESFENVGAILGDKLIPSYPIFILSILQSLEYKSLAQNETSFGYCYQTLIHYSLHKAGVKNEDIDTYFNFLSELAYFFVHKKKEYFSDVELLQFVSDYKARFISPPYEVIINYLKKSNILQFNNEEIRFGYNYILYYLSAKKISDIIHTKEGKKIVNDLFKELHVEKNGNILVFITHHSKDLSFIEESVLNSMVILDTVDPITLAFNDPFYIHIKEIVDELSQDILDINRNPKEEREKQLKKLDKQLTDNDSQDQESTVEKMNKVTLPFKQSFRSIEIVGQILKNRKGSLEKSNLKTMIKELYTTAFRTIGYVGELLEATKKQIILSLNNDESIDSSKFEIEEKINGFIQMSSFEACLGIFSKLMNAMGHKDLRSLYTEVANEINTPAAKLVSFSINSYYNSISESELKTIVNDIKGNHVAQRILRARVKSYVYNRNLDIRTKQKFASLLNMTIAPQKPNIKIN